MKTSAEKYTRADYIEDALLADDVETTAYELVELGIPVVPVHGKDAPERKLEKAPAFSAYTSTSPITDPELAERKVRGRGVAVVPTRASGLVIIDADTDDEVAALAGWWSDNVGGKLPKPTVTTPGVHKDGDWKHSNGGHWWIIISDGMWDEDKKYRATVDVNYNDSHFSIISENKYCIAPPTERSEGFYEAVGKVIDLSQDQLASSLLVDNLVKEIKETELTAEQLNLIATASINSNDPQERIVAWQQSTAWSHILKSAGWKIVDKECGGRCAVAHHPLSTSSRSAVAHEEGCKSGYPPVLKVFSSTAQLDMGVTEEDSIPKWKFWLQYVHGNDSGAAFRAAGIHRDLNGSTRKPSKKTIKKKQKAIADTAPVVEVSTPVEVEADTENLEPVEVEADTENLEPVEVEADTENLEPVEVEADTEEEFDSDDVKNVKLSAADRRFQQVLKYARENFNCRIDVGGAEMWERKNRPGLFESSRMKVVERLQAFAIPGVKVPRDTAEIAATIVSLEASDDFDEGVTESVAPKPRIFASRTATYVDTITPSSGVVKITEDGVEYKHKDDDYQFLRNKSLQAMKVDARKSSVASILTMFKEHINIPRKDWTTVLSWLVLRYAVPGAALPILMVQGGAGSGKSTAGARLKELLDPSIVTESAMPDGQEKLADALYPTSVCFFDNIAGVTQSQSDLLAIAATGGVYAKRKLYTDGERFAQDIFRQVIMTCVDTPVLRADLRSRIVFVTAEKLEVNNSTAGMKYAWEDAVAGFRAALFQIAAEVKYAINHGNYVATSRLSDFSIVQQAMDDVMDKHNIGIPSAAQRSQEASEELARDSIPDIISFIIECVDEKIEGRPAQVLSVLRGLAESKHYPTKTWGTTGKWMGRVINENTEALKGYGIDVETFQSRGQNNYRITPEGAIDEITGTV